MVRVEPVLSSKRSIKCSFCNKSERNDESYGPMYSYGKLTFHFYCMAFSSGINQTLPFGKGIYGFKPADVRNELKVVKELNCVYCGNNGANVRCSESCCSRPFHFSCAVSGKLLVKFMGQFHALCAEHSLEYSTSNTSRKGNWERGPFNFSRMFERYSEMQTKKQSKPVRKGRPTEKEQFLQTFDLSVGAKPSRAAKEGVGVSTRRNKLRIEENARLLTLTTEHNPAVTTSITDDRRVSPAPIADDSHEGRAPIADNSHEGPAPIAEDNTAGPTPIEVIEVPASPFVIKFLREENESEDVIPTPTLNLNWEIEPGYVDPCSAVDGLRPSQVSNVEHRLSLLPVESGDRTLDRRASYTVLDKGTEVDLGCTAREEDASSIFGLVSCFDNDSNNNHSNVQDYETVGEHLALLDPEDSCNIKGFRESESEIGIPTAQLPLTRAEDNVHRGVCLSPEGETSTVAAISPITEAENNLIRDGSGNSETATNTPTSDLPFAETETEGYLIRAGTCNSEMERSIDIRGPRLCDDNNCTIPCITEETNQDRDARGTVSLTKPEGYGVRGGSDHSENENNSPDSDLPSIETDDCLLREPSCNSENAGNIDIGRPRLADDDCSACITEPASQDAGGTASLPESDAYRVRGESEHPENGSSRLTNELLSVEADIRCCNSETEDSINIRGLSLADDCNYVTITSATDERSHSESQDGPGTFAAFLREVESNTIRSGTDASENGESTPSTATPLTKGDGYLIRDDSYHARNESSTEAASIPVPVEGTIEIGGLSLLGNENCATSITDVSDDSDSEDVTKAVEFPLTGSDKCIVREYSDQSENEESTSPTGPSLTEFEEYLIRDGSCTSHTDGSIDIGVLSLSEDDNSVMSIADGSDHILTGVLPTTETESYLIGAGSQIEGRPETRAFNMFDADTCVISSTQDMTTDGLNLDNCSVQLGSPFPEENVNVGVELNGFDMTDFYENCLPTALDEDVECPLVHDNSIAPAISKSTMFLVTDSDAAVPSEFRGTTRINGPHSNENRVSSTTDGATYPESPGLAIEEARSEYCLVSGGEGPAMKTLGVDMHIVSHDGNDVTSVTDGNSPETQDCSGTHGSNIENCLVRARSCSSAENTSIGIDGIALSDHENSFSRLTDGHFVNQDCLRTGDSASESCLQNSGTCHAEFGGSIGLSKLCPTEHEDGTVISHSEVQAGAGASPGDPQNCSVTEGPSLSFRNPSSVEAGRHNMSEDGNYVPLNLPQPEGTSLDRVTVWAGLNPPEDLELANSDSYSNLTPVPSEKSDISLPGPGDPAQNKVIPEFRGLLLANLLSIQNESPGCFEPPPIQLTLRQKEIPVKLYRWGEAAAKGNDGVGTYIPIFDTNLVHANTDEYDDLCRHNIMFPVSELRLDPVPGSTSSGETVPSRKRKGESDNKTLKHPKFDPPVST